MGQTVKQREAAVGRQGLSAVRPPRQAEAGLWRVALDSAHFSFEAYGSTLAQANRTFDALIDAHAAQSGADPDWVESAKRDAVPYEVHAGVGIRDYDVIVKEIA